MEPEFNIEEELKKLPGKPGVYIMHDAADVIIYVGKAVNLKNRVRQYFQSSRNKGPKIEKMVTHIARFEYIVTDSELEALVLECNLIKENSPRYNTMLKDDKTYPFIKVTVQEPYPRILFSREMKKDKAKYFGPYTSAGAVKESIELMRKLYHIRSCNKVLPRDQGKERPCLYYHMKQCLAPCQGYVSQEAYGEQVQGVLDFLNGDYQKLVRQLREEMLQASQELRFEEAAALRDTIKDIERVGERQKITGSGGEDKDIIALSHDGSDAVAQVFFVRDGKMIGREHFYLKVSWEDKDSEILQSFIKQFYAGTPFIPKEIYLQHEIEDLEVITRWLTARRGQKVTVSIPKKGQKEKLVELAAENARMVLDRDRERIKREEGRTIGAVREIERLLGLSGISRMEAFDISNISGYESVGSMVVYEKGKPKKSDYRKFKIKTVQGPDDYSSMREVLTRRFERGLAEQQESGELQGFSALPDLLLMDGGKGQVHIAEEVLAQFALQIPVCGMVKDDHHRTRGLYYQDQEIPIDTHGEGFKLITRIQDEAHRFAIEYHRLLRSKGQVKSVLDDIPGIGPVRRKALMRKYKAAENIRNATEEELAGVEGMNAQSARAVYEFFHSQS